MMTRPNARRAGRTAGICNNGLNPDYNTPGDLHSVGIIFTYTLPKTLSPEHSLLLYKNRFDLRYPTT